MSQSPSENSPLDANNSYVKGWNRLNVLSMSGHSFSGRERNCCFLNTAGGEKFADISSVTGLDFLDDGRGLGLVDWDHDGDLDLWSYNRTAPLVRLLRNDIPKTGSAITFRLEGRQCNRDAIGARLTLEFQDNKGNQQREIRTIHAGSGFLSQSTKWVHFGLGDRPTLDRLTVQWPGGQTEEFTGLSAGQRYRIVQGTGSAEALSDTPRKLALQHSIPKVLANSIEGRGFVSQRLPFPELAYQDFTGGEHEFLDLEGPVLVNLWASWCQPCMKELGEFASEYDQLQAVGLSVLALSTDGLDSQNGSGNRKAAMSISTRKKWPFATGWVSEDLMQELSRWYLKTYNIRHSLPAPTSFLVDREGRIAAIYKGPVSVEQLIADCSLLDLSSEELTAASLPFPGKKGINTSLINSTSYASVSLEGGYYEEAKQLIMEFLDLQKGIDFSTLGEQDKKLLIRIYLMLAEAEKGLGDFEATVNVWRQLIELAPDSPPMQVGLAIALRAAGHEEESQAGFERLSERFSDSGSIQRLIAVTCLQIGARQQARDYFQRAIKVEPDNVQFQMDLAGLFLQEHQTSKAIAIYEELLLKHPGFPEAANNLAWLLSTCDDATIRDGKRAVDLAKIACVASKYKYPSHLGTLAAAYAEIEDFEAALETTQAAIAILIVENRSEEVDLYRSRLKIYLSRQPYRDN